MTLQRGCLAHQPHLSRRREASHSPKPHQSAPKSHRAAHLELLSCLYHWPNAAVSIALVGSRRAHANVSFLPLCNAHLEVEKQDAVHLHSSCKQGHVGCAKKLYGVCALIDIAAVLVRGILFFRWSLGPGWDHFYLGQQEIVFHLGVVKLIATSPLPLAIAL